MNCNVNSKCRVINSSIIFEISLLCVSLAVGVWLTNETISFLENESQPFHFEIRKAFCLGY